MANGMCTFLNNSRLWSDLCLSLLRQPPGHSGPSDSARPSSPGFFTLSASKPEKGNGRLDHVARERIRAQRKLEHDGKIDGIGPNRQHTSLEGTKNTANSGRKRDALVNELVIDDQETIPDKPEKLRNITYCIGCDLYTPYRNPQRAKEHAKDCSVSQFLSFTCQTSKIYIMLPLVRLEDVS